MGIDPPSHDEYRGVPSDLTGGLGAEETRSTDHRSDSHARAVSIEGYDIVREVHRGGQGVIYEAVEKSTKRKVAVKVLIGGQYASKSAQKRFEREIELVAQLKHPNIISLFHSGKTDEGYQFYVMDYLHGARLHDYVREKGLTLEDTLKIFAKVCEAVQYAHQRGVIHRDLKPSNVLVDSQGNPKVLDFGLAKLLAGPVESLVSVTQDVIGTLPYMSPEQARGSPDEVDTRTDVYALGVMLYELLTGGFPYPVIGQMTVVLRHIAETPPTPPTRKWSSASGVARRTSKRLRRSECPIDADVQTIILKALSKQCERRYQSAGEFARDIGHYLASEPIEARRDSGWYVFRVTLRRHRRRIFTGAVAVVAVASAVSSVWIWQKQKALEAQRKYQMAYDCVQRGVSLGEYELWDQAEEAYLEALSVDPNQFDALRNLARLKKDRFRQAPFAQARKTSLEEALGFCDRGLALHPDDAGALNVKSVVLSMLGRTADAREASRSAAGYRPDYYPAQLQLAKVLAMNGDIDEALEVAKTAIALLQRQGVDGTKWATGAWRTLGTIQLQLRQPAALGSFENALRCERTNEWAYLLRARLRLELEGYIDVTAAAVDARIADAITVTSDGRIKRMLALVYLRSDKFGEAIEHAQAAIANGDLEVVNQLIISVAEAKRGRLDEARRWYERAAQAPRPEGSAERGWTASADREVLWFESATDLDRLWTEAQALIAPDSP